MQLVYSALRTQGISTGPLARRQGYLAACHKHSDTIAAIQRYLPGWRPSFELHGSQLAVASGRLAVYNSL